MENSFEKVSQRLQEVEETAKEASENGIEHEVLYKTGVARGLRECL
jgi:hypothetical protein